MTARRLKLLNQVANPSAVKQLAIGDAVPDFTLIDQNQRRVTFSKFAGKVVALNFWLHALRFAEFLLSQFE